MSIVKIDKRKGLGYSFHEKNRSNLHLELTNRGEIEMDKS